MRFGDTDQISVTVPDPTVSALIEQIERLTVNVMRLMKQGDDAIALLIRVADTLPQSCECNYETADGRTVGQTCLPHQALAFIAKLPK
jgi:hypothetical protein